MLCNVGYCAQRGADVTKEAAAFNLCSSYINSAALHTNYK